MNNKNRRYLLEFRIKGEFDWREGSRFSNLRHAKVCVDATLHNNPLILEGRVFDWKLMAYRYYCTAYPFKP